MGSLAQKVNTLFLYACLLVALEFEEEPLFWLSLVPLVVLSIFLGSRRAAADWLTWQEHRMGWLKRDDVFVATLLTTLTLAGTSIGAIEGDVLRGVVYGLAMGIIALGLHYVFYGNWKHRVFG